jgi:hypothetical protein
MPIEYRIDHERRLVIAEGSGTMTDEDVFGYQRNVWSRPEIAGYDELIDMRRVEQIALPSNERMQELAGLSAGMDPRSSSSRFAIVAPTDLAYGLGRMYEAYRGLDNRSTKQVKVFRSMDEALAFLGTSSVIKEDRD